MVTLLCWVARTRAEEVTEASAGTRPLTATPFQLILPREHLLGDWFTARTWLEDHGITPTLTFVTDSLGNPSGGNDQGFTTANNVGLDLNFDLGKLGIVEGESFLLSMSYRFGGSLSANYIHNVFTVQQVFGGETFHFINMAYFQKLFDDRVELRIGRIGTGDDFLVSPYNYVFVQNGLLARTAMTEGVSSFAPTKYSARLLNLNVRC
jgi:carbohydrate-selective porin OprB